MDYSHLKPEDKARHDLINPALKKAGWTIQNFKSAFEGKLVEVENYE